MKNNISGKFGFTLVEIMIVVAIIGLLAAIAIPNFVHARTSAQQNACINNLRQIDGAKQQWALENRQNSTATPVLGNIQPYLGRGSAGSVAACPADPNKQFSSSYSINDCQTDPSCLINSTTHVLDPTPSGSSQSPVVPSGGGSGGGVGH